MNQCWNDEMVTDLLFLRCLSEQTKKDGIFDRLLPSEKSLVRLFRGQNVELS